MNFRKATPEDRDQIFALFSAARQYFKENGIDQWQDGYSQLSVIDADIAAGRCRVLSDGTEILATLALLFEPEPTYAQIYEGNFKKALPYATVHRVAVSPFKKRGGLASEMLEAAALLSRTKGFHSLRADTHRDNLPMQGLLKKNGFFYCGIIYLENGSERLAFEKEL